MIYLDSSAVIKLVRRETGSSELLDWLAGHPESVLISSVLVAVEVPRVIRRYAPGALARIPRVLAGLVRIEVDPTIRATARAYANSALRSLDAIHLATADFAASQGEPLEAFVAYDRRLLVAAQARGFPTASRGLD